MASKRRDANGRFAGRERDDPAGAQDVAHGVAEPDGVMGRSLDKAPRPRFCRVYVRRKLAEALPGIVRVMVKKAKQGSVPHMALLLKTAGLDQRGNLIPQIVRRERTLEEILMEQWEKDRPKELGEAV